MISIASGRVTPEIRRQTQLTQEIAGLQASISSGKKIAQPSDDPVAASRLSTIRRAQADDSAWAINIDRALASTAQADTVLRTVSSQLARAQELLVAGASGTASPADRATIAIELRSIADELDSLQQTVTPEGYPLFAAGQALSMRFGDNVVFAPVPSQSEAFQVNGVAVGQLMRDAAGFVESGDADKIDLALNSVKLSVALGADNAADLGLRAARLERLKDGTALRGVELASERSLLEDTDLSEAISALTSKLVTLEAAQTAFARINRRTLIDILS